MAALRIAISLFLSAAIVAGGVGCQLTLPKRKHSTADSSPPSPPAAGAVQQASGESTGEETVTPITITQPANEPNSRQAEPAVAEVPAAPTANLGESEPVQKGALSPADPAENLQFVQDLLQRSKNFYAENTMYTCRVTRRERVGMRIQPPEMMLMNFRLQPRSVFYEWLDAENAGRACVWVQGENDGKLVSLGGRSDFLFAGKRMSVDPEGTLAKSRSRYPITESGSDQMVDRLIDAVARMKQKQEPYVRTQCYGLIKRQDLEFAAVHLEQQMPPGADAVFPKGAVRQWYFDPKTARIMLMTTTDPKGEFLEYYRFDRFYPNPSLTSADFNPDQLWPERKTASAPEGSRKAVKVAERSAEPSK